MVRERVVCPYEGCEDSFYGLGQHWRWNPEHRPDITDRQKEILTGCLLGDGHVETHNSNPFVRVGNSVLPFLEWIDDEMGSISSSLSLHLTADEVAENSRFDSSPGDCRDHYRWTSRSHPDFRIFEDWVSSGRKRFPDDLELTPLILKVWYCCDGYMKEEKRWYGRPSLTIKANNESDRGDYISSLFESIGFSPRLDIFEGDYGEEMNICFGVDESEQLWNYMGEPLPGFEYKWPSN